MIDSIEPVPLGISSGAQFAPYCSTLIKSRYSRAHVETAGVGPAVHGILFLTIPPTTHFIYCLLHLHPWYNNYNNDIARNEESR